MGCAKDWRMSHMLTQRAAQSREKPHQTATRAGDGQCGVCDWSPEVSPDIADRGFRVHKYPSCKSTYPITCYHSYACTSVRNVQQLALHARPEIATRGECARDSAHTRSAANDMRPHKPNARASRRACACGPLRRGQTAWAAVAAAVAAAQSNIAPASTARPLRRQARRGGSHSPA